KQYRESDGQFYFKLVDAQGKLLLQSTGYAAPKDAGQAIRALQQADAALAQFTPADGVTQQDVVSALHQLRDAGNTIVVIEHNLDVIKTADWVIDMGPEGGSGGGTLVAQGTPEEVAACAASHTGRYLAPLLRR
ncbi:MAG: DUF1508 domain-containing protein, partial [Inhella sp.]